VEHRKSEDKGSEGLNTGIRFSENCRGLFHRPALCRILWRFSKDDSHDGLRP
jgi:hypothetical protein